ncbi:MAG: NAD(P)H-dependent oxidoreductase subunit E [Planctomycetota bacterium]|nr:NAD(P)H-dependent oxidoreductase subunit E [Planctomycetota bacterium]MDA1162740.1 NAD(P)H-dependent oxidoreductase subunit E [Planctomycetota bacterium]
MKLLRELMRVQHEFGWLSDETLREIAVQQRVPLYRLEGLVSFYPSFRRTPPPRRTVHVCRDVACVMGGCAELHSDLRASLASQEDVELVEVSCIGRCEHAPAVSIDEVPVEEVSLENLLRLIDGSQSLPCNEPTETPRKWKSDPYKTSGERYGTVRKLAADPGEVCIEALKESGLRGMGGAGFPTGRKWELVRSETASPKYIICNADESEPGTFKDRVILEELPHLVIEGMLLAGLTIGAESGIVFLRHEYGREQKALEAAIEQARHSGILGDNAAGSGKRFDIEIFVSPGGYILGEETALLEALEDKRGEPRNKPPYPGTFGLWGKPTLINNVETYALATSIVSHGVDWWRAQAAGKFVGLKFVSVSGDVKQPGVYEIPIGTTVAELIELAGGMRDGCTLQAFLPGGASSNFLPADKVNTPLDFDSMKAVGSMLGTGAVIVISDRHDLFALATNIVRFFRNESCGKCVPCRVGSQKAVQILDSITCGQADVSELSILPELGETLEQTSICGLGQVALNPILSLMKNVPESVPLDSLPS